MKASGWLVLTGMLMIIGITTGCQQPAERPRLDTRNQQTFSKSLNQVRSQVDSNSIEQFDQAIHHAQHRHYLQKQYSLLPTSNPLHGLNAKDVLELAIDNQRKNTRRLNHWMSM